MLRQDLPRTEPDRAILNARSEAPSGNAYGDAPRKRGVDIQGELEKLKEFILTSPRIPITHWTMVDEDQLADQIELIQEQLPSAFREATDIVRQKEEILFQAEHYAQEMLDAAEQQATQILDESGIIQRAEIEAQQVWQRVQQECNAAQDQAIAEIDRLRSQARQELDDMRRQAMAECEEIQQGADDYADRVLQSIEQQLGDMMRIVRNGRQQLSPSESPATSVTSAASAPAPTVRSQPQPAKPSTKAAKTPKTTKS